MEGAQRRDRVSDAVPGLSGDDSLARGDPLLPRGEVVIETPESGVEVELLDLEPRRAAMRADVLRGLAATPKYLPSQYLYDERGAKLFEDICELDEYYLTRTEFSILRRALPAIARRIGPRALVIEPGSGSGIKARLLLSGLEDPAGFIPVDISRLQLVEVAATFQERSPELEVMPVCADFTEGFELPAGTEDERRRICFLPGSTIGNFDPEPAVQVLRRLTEACGPEGGVLIGVDLKKPREILEPAYDDARGVSRAFALNYLTRLNRELAADFVPAQFGYQAPYHDEHGRIEMSLVSKVAQTVPLGDATVSFAAGELISTEYSYKFDLEGFASLAARAGLAVRDVWTDDRHYFSVQYLTPHK